MPPVRRYLYSNTLSGTIPESLGQLTKLQWLCVSSQFLTVSVQTTHCQRTTLCTHHVAPVCRWLYNNALSGTIPDSLGQLTNLQKLCVSSPFLTISVQITR